MSSNSDDKITQLLLDPSTRRKGFEMLVKQYGEQLYWKIRSMVLSHDDADDILQDTFVKAWRSLDSFRGDAKVSSWLYRIAINESLDFIRHKKSQTAVRADVDAGIANHLMADEYFDGDRGQALLQEAIQTLPDVQRTVFNLRYYDEMKYADMSRLLGTSEGALKASYHFAVKKVTEYIKKRA